MSEQAYLNLLKHVLDNGIESNDRTGTGTLSCFGEHLKFDLSNNTLPLLTTKKVHYKSVLIELCWFLRGRSDVKYLQDFGVKIWDPWVNELGQLGPIYPVQYRNFNGVDQLTNVINSIKKNPESRRHIVSAWNVNELPNMALEPCHTLFQFYVRNGKLSCHLYQRSCDAFIGQPFNIASYSLLTHMIAHECNLKAKELVISYGDIHIYKNHIDQVKEQLTRTPYEFPKVEINLGFKLLDFAAISDTLSWDFIKEHFKLIDYKSHATIKAPIAV